PDAIAKARLCGGALLKRIGSTSARTNIECLGAGACSPGIAAPGDPPEVVLRVTMHDPHQETVERFAKEFAPLVTSGTPGVTGYTTGRPPVRDVFAYWPALIAKSLVAPEVRIQP